jgi:5-carboxymethyl-2-hydroxymuconate isomerase
MISYHVNFIATTAQRSLRIVPHLIVEYSANVEDRIDLNALLDRLHLTATESGMFPLGGIRVRAYRADSYRIADCDSENGFVHVTAMVGAGRTLERRAEVSRLLFDALCDQLAEAQATSPLAISFNMREFDSVLSLKKNNLHEFVDRRASEEPDV